MIESGDRIDLSDAGRFGFPSLRSPAQEGYAPRYFLDDALIRSEYGHTLPVAMRDLLDIAGSVMWIDRQRRRPAQRGPFGRARAWSRMLPVTLGVREVDRWRQPHIKETLEELLFWLTEDHWDLHFAPQVGARRRSDLQDRLFSSPAKSYMVTLFSGGLDSLAGAVDLLQRYPHHTLVLMCAVHNRLWPVVKRQSDALRHAFGEERVLFAPFPFHLVKREFDAKKQREEHTQRTRGFLFLAFGAATAAAFGATRIVVCENGVGALNLPMDWCQLGTQNTRAVHPRTLVTMSHLLALIGQEHLEYVAPNMLRTKGEICTALANPTLWSLVRLTVSCDSFPFRLKATTDAPLHCGWCTSCVLRRQAIYAAGLDAAETPSYYRHDLCHPAPGLKPSYFERLKVMLDQRYLFAKAVEAPAPELALSEHFPEVVPAARLIEERSDAFGLSAGTPGLTAVTRLLARYAAEWERFPYRLRAPQ